MMDKAKFLQHFENAEITPIRKIDCYFGTFNTIKRKQWLKYPKKQKTEIEYLVSGQAVADAFDPDDNHIRFLLNNAERVVRVFDVYDRPIGQGPTQSLVLAISD